MRKLDNKAGGWSKTYWV